MTAQNARLVTVPKEASPIRYPRHPAAPAMMAPARLTNYVFAHSKYSWAWGRAILLSTLLSEDADAAAAARRRIRGAPSRRRRPAMCRPLHDGRPLHEDRGPALTG
jgi:hypothetical protein